MHVIIVGGGKVGTYLTGLLVEGGHQVRLIETRDKQIASLRRELSADVVIQGNGTDPALLEATGIRQTNVVAAVTGADETNLVVASLARYEFNVPRIIARVNNPKNAWLYTKEMGVDVALNQADLMGRLIAEEMSLGDMMTLLKLRRGQFSLVEEKVHPESWAAGKLIRDLELPSQCVLFAIIREGELMVPRGDTRLLPADEVLAIVHQTQLGGLAVQLGRQSAHV